MTIIRLKANYKNTPKESTYQRYVIIYINSIYVSFTNDIFYLTILFASLVCFFRNLISSL